MSSPLDIPKPRGPKAAEPRRIFFSYGHDGNRPIVERFRRDLEERGHRVWIDYDRIGTWEDWRGRITEGIHESDMAVAFLSVHSVRNPGVCRQEIAMALQHFGRVYPLLVEELGNQADLPLTLGHLQWPDLSGWRAAMEDGASEGFEAYYQDRLAEVIRKIEGDASRFRQETGFLEKVLQPLSFEGRYREHLGSFCGRRWLSDALAAWMEQDAPASRLFWLSAGPGFGKTAWAVHTVARNPATVVGAWFCEQGNRDSCDPASALTTLAFQLAQRLDDYRSCLIAALTRSKETGSESAPPIEPEQYADGTPSPEEGEHGEEAAEPQSEFAPAQIWLQDGRFPDPGSVRARLSGRGCRELFALLFSEPMRGMVPRVVRHAIVLDALDEACLSGAENPLADLLDGHLMQLPDWLCVVVTSRPDPLVVHRLGRFVPVEIEATDQRNEADLREYAGLSLEPLPVVQSMEAEARGHFLQDAVWKSGGMMLYLQRLAEALAKGILLPGQLSAVGTGVAGLESFYVRDFQQRFGGRFQADYQPLLRLVMAAPGALSEGLAAAILGDSEAVRRARIGLGSYLRNDPANLQVCHKTLSDWVTGQRSVHFFTDPEKGRNQIAAFLFKCFKERDLDSGQSRVTMPFEREVLAWLPDLFPLLQEWRDALALRQFGTFLSGRGFHESAVRLTARAFRIASRKEKAGSAAHLRSVRAHGVALHKSGDFEAAIPVLREGLKWREKLPGPGNEHLLTSLEDLAVCLLRAGSHKECVKLRSRAVELLLQSDGREAVRTQTAMRRLAEAQDAAGDKKAALASWTALQEILCSAYGFADLRTLYSASMKARMERDLGRLEAARDLAVEVSKVMESQLHPDHPEVLRMKSILGSIEDELGNSTAAEALYRFVHARRSEKDPQSAAALLVLCRLGRMLARVRRADEACAMVEPVWKERAGTVTAADGAGIDLLMLYATLLKCSGRTCEAVELLRGRADLFEGPHSVLRYNLACYECLEGNLEEARSLLMEHLRRHPGHREQALADPDLEAIRSEAWLSGGSC